MSKQPICKLVASVQHSACCAERDSLRRRLERTDQVLAHSALVTSNVKLACALATEIFFISFPLMRLAAERAGLATLKASYII